MVGQYCIKGIAALRPSNQVTFNSTRDHDDREPYPSPVSPLHTLSFEIRPDTDRKYPVIIEFQTPRPIARSFQWGKCQRVYVFSLPCFGCFNGFMLMRTVGAGIQNIKTLKTKLPKVLQRLTSHKSLIPKQMRRSQKDAAPKVGWVTYLGSFESDCCLNDVGVTYISTSIYGLIHMSQQKTHFELMIRNRSPARECQIKQLTRPSECHHGHLKGINLI